MERLLSGGPGRRVPDLVNRVLLHGIGAADTARTAQSLYAAGRHSAQGRALDGAPLRWTAGGEFRTYRTLAATGLRVEVPAVALAGPGPGGRPGSTWQPQLSRCSISAGSRTMRRGAKGSSSLRNNSWTA
jgi:hypothetical protein